ncbi:hypothetical protein ACFVZM_34445 [Streptomyces sioyaensis]|uniref:hypothetical protein n=1 Tax=Streptomyces TaxID=1883 RepID=UPI00101071E3|nr:hypothetical protein [Streptomyces sp. TM32]RXS71141.1 hypothetical protein EST92_24090 [Streptomyces sp. TM32]
MTKPVKAVTPSPDAPARRDPESLDELRGDCARMEGRWSAGRRPAPAPGRSADLHGVKVPSSSAALLDGMSEYGD